MSTFLNATMGPSLDLGVIHELPNLNNGHGRGPGNEMFVQSGYELLMKLTILWQIDNFFIGLKGDPFSEHIFKLHSSGHKVEQLLKDVTWTFRLFPKETDYSWTDTVLECTSKKEKGKLAKNLLYAVEADVRGNSSEKWQSSVTEVGDKTEVFNIEDYKMMRIMSGVQNLIVEITVTAFRKKPTVTISMDIGDDASVSSVKINYEPASSGSNRFIYSSWTGLFLPFILAIYCSPV